jgi:hypothetical protein
MLRHRDVTWSNPRVLLTLTLIFLCGAAFGVVITSSYYRPLRPPQAAVPSAIERARHVGLSNLKLKLNLTPSQEQTVMKILDDYGKFYQNIEDEREDVAQDGKKRILEVLTPDQRKLFNEMVGQGRR